MVRSSSIVSLPRFQAANRAGSDRSGSPPGRSTFTTSAPRSAKIVAAKGAATYWPISTTRRPSSTTFSAHGPLPASTRGSPRSSATAITLRTTSSVPPPMEAERELSSWSHHRPPSGSAGSHRDGVHPGDLDGDEQADCCTSWAMASLSAEGRGGVALPSLGLEVAPEMPQHHLADAQLDEPVAQDGAGRQVAPPGLGRQCGEAPLAAPAPEPRAPRARAPWKANIARHPPPAVDVSEDAVARHSHAVQEHLVEMRITCHLAQRVEPDKPGERMSTRNIVSPSRLG